MAIPATEGEVLSAWVDFNGHMSAPYYAVAFGEANDAALRVLGFGAEWRARGRGLFVVEAHYRYLRQMRAGDRFRITTHPSKAYSKRLWLTHRMLRIGGESAAEAEILFLHVATDGPKAVPFEADDRARLVAFLGEPAQLEA
ncbi:MAG: thioesterase family protein [Rhodobacteraceae bacterium]|nr:thioesterase family protein [Paracoccaceae bacterium]